MSGSGILYQAFVYLAAAVVTVPLAKRLGLGSVLGYLFAGIAIGPFGLRLLGSEGQDVMHFAEFGVVMMLFVVGLELQPALLWRLRAPILGMGGLQVLGTTILVAIGSVLVGLHWKMAIAIGLTLAMSSTAIVLQTLAEKNQLKTEGGQGAFAVLLFQDISVIPILAIFPFLATVPRVADVGGHEAETLLHSAPAWVQAAALLAAVGIVVGGSRFLLRPIFRAIARTRLREVFTAATLLLVIGISLLMGQVGLSPALGTFLAGVVLADSEYRHELESDIDPFKGLLLGLFFIAVGATIDFGLIVARPVLVLALVVGILAAKFATLFALGKAFGMRRDQCLLFAFALPQVGEFAFVLFSFGNQEGVFTPAVTGPLVAAVALSMALTPLLIVFNERVVLPRLGPPEKAERKADEIDEHGAVLIAGFGSFGSTVGRLLRANGVATTVLDLDSDRVELLRRLGLKVYYGDASRHDLLTAAGAGHARLLIIALDSPERTLQLVHTVKKHFPQITIMARAFDWEDAHDLVEAGVSNVYFQSLDTSMRVGVEALQMLGFRAYHSHRAARQFLKHDMESLHALTADRKVSQASYLSAARKRIEDLERRLEADRQDQGTDRDQGWDAESLREDVRSSAQNSDLPE
jgi:monovalent cation:proton antiporter-2 (CPA2) family protein